MSEDDASPPALPPVAWTLPDRVTRLEVLRQSDHERAMEFERSIHKSIEDVRPEFPPIREALEKLLNREAHAAGVWTAGKVAFAGFARLVWFVVAGAAGYAVKHIHDLMTGAQ